MALPLPALHSASPPPPPPPHTLSVVLFIVSMTRRCNRLHGAVVCARLGPRPGPRPGPRADTDHADSAMRAAQVLPFQIFDFNVCILASHCDGRAFAA